MVRHTRACERRVDARRRHARVAFMVGPTPTPTARSPTPLRPLLGRRGCPVFRGRRSTELLPAHGSALRLQGPAPDLGDAARTTGVLEMLDNCAWLHAAHAEPCIAAAKAGKHVLCEKPIGAEHGRRATLSARRRRGGRRQAHGAFNYRFASAVRLARELIQSGVLARSASSADSLPPGLARRPSARSFAERTPLGRALGDLGAHVIDLARYLVGEIDAVSALDRDLPAPARGRRRLRGGGRLRRRCGRDDRGDALCHLPQERLPPGGQRQARAPSPSTSSASTSSRSTSRARGRGPRSKASGPCSPPRPSTRSGSTGGRRGTSSAGSDTFVHELHHLLTRDPATTATSPRTAPRSRTATARPRVCDAIVRSFGQSGARETVLPLTHMGREGHAINPPAPPRSHSPSPRAAGRRAAPARTTATSHHAQPLSSATAAPRVPARAHPRVLRARHPHGRRLHRARPRLHQGRRARRAPRDRDQRHDRRRGPPGVRRPPDDQDIDGPPSPAGSPRTSPSPSSRRCGPRSASRDPPAEHRLRRPVRGADASRRSLDLAQQQARERTGGSASTRRPSTRPTSARSGLALEPPLCAPLARNGLDRADARSSCSPSRRATSAPCDRCQGAAVQLLDADARAYDFVEAGDPRTYADLVKPGGLSGSRVSPTGIGPEWTDHPARRRPREPTTLVGRPRAPADPAPVHGPRREHLPAGRVTAGPDPNAYGDAFEARSAPYFALGIDGIVLRQRRHRVAAKRAFTRRSRRPRRSTAVASSSSARRLNEKRSSLAPPSPG